MIKKIEFLVIQFMIVMLALHYLFITILLKDYEILKYWKDLAIIGLAAIGCYRIIKKKYLYKLNKVEMLICCVLVLFIIYMFLSPNKYAAVYIIRVYVEPLIIYFIIKNIELTKNQYEKLIKTIFISASIISIYGVIQSIFLGHEFLKSIGYAYRSNGRLTPSYYLSGLGNFQRVAGTLVSPNIYAFYAATVIIMAFTNIKIIKKVKYYQLGIGAIIISICLTFSRSTLGALGLIFILVIIFAEQRKKMFKLFVISLSALIIGITIIGSISRVNIIGNFTHLVKSTLTLDDTSAVSHISSFNDSLKLITEKPLGTGLGTNGPKAQQFVKNANLTESSYFLMSFELGILGCLVYYSIYLHILLKNKKKYDLLKIKQGPNINMVFLSIFSLLAFLFLPYIQDMEIMAYYFFFAGLADNKIVENIKGVINE